MRSRKQTQTEKYVKEHQKRKWWQRGVSVLAAIAVFCTTYAMILPAITWERSLVCELPEHHHEESCYEVTTIPAEKELVCQTTEHQHGPECYEQTLICNVEESEGHTHSADCYRKDLVCSNEEHAHTDECYRTVGEEHEEKVLVCQLEEHEHSAACFDAPPTEDDGYYCGQIEHIHSEKKYCFFEDGSLKCSIPEHVHTLACKSNPKADVENEAAWVSSFASVSLTGNWAEDVIAIAKTQIGYTESTQNYEVQEDGTTIKGYTRYGNWYGIPYGDWCAMFCAFCQHYAGVKSAQMPISAGCESWVRSLKEKDLYHEVNSGYEPIPGDLIFFDWDEYAPEHPEARKADHVGLVYEINKDSITTIEGNWSDCVCTIERKFSDGKILGYGELPENPDYATIESAPASDGAIAVISGYLPEGAEAVIEEIPYTGSDLTELLGEETASSVMSYVAYDITIWVNGEEWQPDATVSVVIKHPDIEVEDSSSLAVAHVDEEADAVSDITVEINDDGDITFETDGFSTYILYVSGNQTTVILACSDVQEPTNSYLFSNGNYTKQTQILTNIVSQVKKVYPTISGFFCGGDYNFDVTRGDSAKTQLGAEIVSGTMKDLIPGMTDEKMVLIQGNHDDLCSALTPTGGYDKGAYSVYVINEQSFPSGGTATQNLCQQTADGLRSWLNGLKQANYNKPVFILSHVPLHYSTRVISDGDAVYAQLLYDAIESYGNDLNIIFLYGHDHAHGDDDYLGGAAQFLTRGDKITIAQSGTRTGTLEKTLNFTYMNYGFVGYFWDTWGQQSGTINYNTDYTLTMTTFEINGSDVTIRRWDENGQHVLKAAGAASLGLRGVADPLPPNTKTYASPQTVKSPKGSSYEDANSFTDPATSVTVKTASGSGITVTRRTDITAKAGVTDFLAYDITVSGYTPGTTAVVTMPSHPGFNKVWWYNNGAWEGVEDYVFSGNTVTFTTDHFSTYIGGVEVPLDEGEWYLVKTPASELRPGDSVLVLSNDESVILYPGEDYAWPEPGPIPSAYTEYYGGVLESVEYNGKTYYPYDANLQDYCSESALTVTSSMGLKNCNGKILDLNFNADNWDQTFFQSGGAVINADGTITQTIGGTKHYLTYNPATDAWLSFRSSTTNSQYAQLVFYRLEQFEAPEPEDDDYQIVGGDGRLSDLEDFTYRTVKAAGDACLYHTNTVVTPQTPFANGTNDKIEFYNAFVVDGHTYNVCMKVKFNDPPANTQLYWGAKTYSTEWGYISLGQFRNTPTYYEWWTEADMYEPETDIDWELWLEDANGNRIDDARLFRETGYHLAGGSVYVASNEYVSVYSRDNTLYTDVPEGIEFDATEGRWHTIDDAYNLPEDYIAGIAGQEGVVKGTYRKDFTDAGCELALGTYGRVVPIEPEQPDIPEEIWPGDNDFEKYEKTTAATGIEGTSGTENVHTICLDVVPPEKKDIAILMLMDTTSSMSVQCTNCGVPSDCHTYSGQPCEVTHWDGTTTTVYACDHFVERKGISEASAEAFINSLGNLPNQNGKVYVRLVPFAGEAHPEYNNGTWIDVTANGGVAAAKTALKNLPKYSGTNVSAAMRSAYDILSNGLPSGVSSADTFVLLLTDGAQSVTDLANLPAEATSTAYVNKWLNIWSSYNHYEYIPAAQRHVDTENPLHTVNDGYYIGAPYYAEKITDDDGLNSHLYTVMLGNNLDWGSKYDFENWRYIAGIGITAHDHLKSFSDYSLYTSSATELTAYYNSILYALSPVLETISVTDPMSEHVDFLTFTDSNGSTKTISQDVAVYDANTGTITWNPKAATPDADGHYRLYYNVRIKTEATGFVDGQLYPANDTAAATYTLKYPDGHTETGTKEVPDPEIKGQLGLLSFTKVSANGTPLSGAKFKLVHDADCPWCHHNDWPYRDGKTFGDITFGSDANGNVSVSNIPSGHTYKLYETKAPDGYLPFSGSLNVTVAYGKVTVSGAAGVWDNTHRYLTDPTDTVKLTITKEIVGVTSTETFPFEVTLKDGNGQIVKLTAGTYTAQGSVSYTVDIYGKITFALSHGQSVIIDAIPIGTIATVTETQHNGFNVKFTDPNGYVNNSATDNFNLTNAREITVTNMAGAELPATGGIGVYPIYALGALLVAGPIVYGCILRRKRERRAK